MPVVTSGRGLDPLFDYLHGVADDGERGLAKLKPAWSKAAFFFRTGRRLGHGHASMRCMSLLEMHRMLEVYRARFNEGDTLSLLQAVSLCAEENLPLPEWLATSFRTQLNLFARPGRVNSLDEVFRSDAVPTGSAKKAAAAKLDWELGGRLWHDVWDIITDDQTIQSFDAAVACLLASKEYGVGKTKAKSLILMIDKSQSQFLGKHQMLSRFLLKRRKQVT